MESDFAVGAIWLNMYCGIMDSVKVALCITDIYKNKQLTKPIVITMKGRNSEEGLSLIEKLSADYPVYIEDDWDLAALKVKEESEKEIIIRKRARDLKA